jgi:hypothetical protein
MLSIAVRVLLPASRTQHQCGEGATVQFDSSFAHKVVAVETVVLTLEKGAWSVVSNSFD